MYQNPLHLRVSSFRSRILAGIMLATFLFSFVPSVSLAQQPTATISALNGTVLVNGQATETGTILSAGDRIETQAGASALLDLSDGSQLELGEQTQLDIAVLAQTGTGARVSRVKVAWGWLRAKLSPGHQSEGSSFDMETPNALVGVKFSQPDVEIRYDPAKQETIALARTVALVAKNLLTNEEVFVPVGSTVIITPTATKVIAGLISLGTTETERAEAEMTEAAVGGGVSTTTIALVGLGVAGLAGGVVALTSSSGGGDGSDNTTFTGTFRREFSSEALPLGARMDANLTFNLTQSDGTITGDLEFRTIVYEAGGGICCDGDVVSTPVTGTVNGTSAVLTAPYREGVCAPGTCVVTWVLPVGGGTYDYTLEDNGRTLRSLNDQMQFLDTAPVKDYDRIN
jgi:hypothetical protein